MNLERLTDEQIEAQRFAARLALQTGSPAQRREAMKRLDAIGQELARRRRTRP